MIECLFKLFLNGSVGAGGLIAWVCSQIPYWAAELDCILFSKKVNGFSGIVETDIYV